MNQDNFYTVDERRDLVISKTKEQSIAFATKHFIMCANNAMQRHNAFFVALSGGSTPLAIYQALAKEHVTLNWSCVHLFWGDERPVPENHIESNYYTAMQAGLATLSIPSKNIHRMVAEQEMEDNAKKYEEKILSHLHLSDSRGFDLVMLGMGEDGHVASLFPNTKAILETKRWVVANAVPQKNTFRMTITLPCINAAANIAIYVMGKTKESMTTKALISKEKNLHIPASLIGTNVHKALWIADEEAAQGYLNHCKTNPC